MMHVYTTPEFERERERVSRNKTRAIWALSIAVTLLLAVYVAQVCATVRSDREASELREQCDELRNAIGMANYEIGIREEELWSR